MLINILFFLLEVNSSGTLSEIEFCKKFSLLNQCQFSIAKHRIHHTIIISQSGLGQSECRNKLERFRWSTGIYCPLSWFCGLGMDFERKYDSSKSDDAIPVKELCHIWVQSDVVDCKAFFASLFSSEILKGTLF